MALYESNPAEWAARELVKEFLAGRTLASMSEEYALPRSHLKRLFRTRLGKHTSRGRLLRNAIRRLHARGMSDGEMAKMLGVSRRRISETRWHMGLPCRTVRRPFSRDEIEVVKRDYHTKPVKEIARSLGRKMFQVYHLAVRIGLAAKRPRLENRPGLAEFIRARHADGWSDAEIGRAVKSDRHHISNFRRKLGLPDNRWSEHLRQKVREKTAEQLRKAGLPSLAYLRIAAFKKYARDHGWPEDLKPRQVQILDLLWKNGPMTREAIGAALGLKKHLRRLSSGKIEGWYPMMCNQPGGHNAGTSYTGDLLRRGLIISLGRIVRNKHPGDRTGQSRNTWLYSLPPTIERGPVKETSNVA